MNLTNSKGAALAFSLVLLTSLTLLALVGLQRSTMQIRMVSNIEREDYIGDVSYSELESNFQDISSTNVDNQLLLNALDSIKIENGVAVRDNNGLPIPIPVYIAPKSDYGKPEFDINTDIKLEGIPTNTNTNHSLAGDSSKGQFTDYKFGFQSEVSDPSSGIKSIQQLGFTYTIKSGI